MSKNENELENKAFFELEEEDVAEVIELKKSFLIKKENYIDSIIKNEKLDDYSKLRLFENEMLFGFTNEIPHIIYKELRSFLSCFQSKSLFTFSELYSMLDFDDHRYTLYKYACETKSCFYRT